MTSSMVEDTFYVLRCAIERSLAAGHPQTCSAVVNHANNALNENVLRYLHAKATAAVPVLTRDPGQALAIAQVAK
jgi:hypothetical protein